MPSFRLLISCLLDNFIHLCIALILYLIGEPLRIILSDVYGEGKGVAARGKVVQGFLQTGEKLVLLPLGDIVTVAQLQHLHPPSDDRLASFGVAGETIDLTLTGTDSVRVTIGSLLSRSQTRPHVTKRCRAKLVIMDNLTIPIIRGAQVLFHIHNLDIPAYVTQLISCTTKQRTKARPRAISSSSTAEVEITLSDRICMEPFAECRSLGRFVLRRSGETIAVGIIEEVY
jgi:elongation factor 1 alpha-like protein